MIDVLKVECFKIGTMTYPLIPTPTTMIYKCKFTLREESRNKEERDNRGRKHRFYNAFFHVDTIAIKLTWASFKQS